MYLINNDINNSGTEFLTFDLSSKEELEYLINNNIMNDAMNKLAYYDLICNIDNNKRFSLTRIITTKNEISEKFVLTGENKSVIMTRYGKVKEQLRKIELLYLNNNEQLSLFSSIGCEDLTSNRFQTIK